mmetsp:Transcript_134497/g.268437  ORF Transcript_134497/g.268437 Transcript_134497/m.268437 type:complete len:100 (+) Transcript_134497:188-487(+)
MARKGIVLSGRDAPAPESMDSGHNIVKMPCANVTQTTYLRNGTRVTIGSKPQAVAVNITVERSIATGNGRRKTPSTDAKGTCEWHFACSLTRKTRRNSR